MAVIFRNKFRVKNQNEANRVQSKHWAGRLSQFVISKAGHSTLPCQAKITGQFSKRMENRVPLVKKPAVAEVEAGGFGYFVFGDELAGEGGHGFIVLEISRHFRPSG